jgi:cell division protein FtsI (penicillin-binding protein 3)
LGVSTHSSGEDDWIKATKIGNALQLKNNLILKDQVPDVKGMTFKDALYLLEKTGLRVSYEGLGRVSEQSITPGSKFTKGSKIYLRLS